MKNAADERRSYANPSGALIFPLLFLESKNIQITKPKINDINMITVVVTKLLSFITTFLPR